MLEEQCDIRQCNLPSCDTLVWARVHSMIIEINPAFIKNSAPTIPRCQMTSVRRALKIMLMLSYYQLIKSISKSAVILILVKKPILRVIRQKKSRKFSF